MKTSKRVSALASVMAVGLIATACSTNGGSEGQKTEQTLNVLMANNEQMLNLQKLTPEHFTKKTGIKVNYTVLPENELRDKAQAEFSSQAGQYDVSTLSNFEVPIWAGFDWLADLDDYVADDADYDSADVFPSMANSLKGANGATYAIPFYGESSFVMYRTDVFEDLGVEMPDQPTWKEIEELAALAHGSEPGLNGICLRGLPGWGQQGAVLNTIVNTFGGTWFTEDWQAQVDSPEYVEAVEFYVDLLRNYGPGDAATLGTSQCLDTFKNGKAAIFYDSTTLAGQVDSDDAAVSGNVGYTQAPVKETEASGWLYMWSWAIQQGSDNKDAAWEFISWASSAEYEELSGTEFGWKHIPDGKRASTYERPEYKEAAGAYSDEVLKAIEGADAENPGVQPRPTLGVQFVAIPEFAELGTSVSQLIADSLAGQRSVADALDEGQRLAEKVAAEYK